MDPRTYPEFIAIYDLLRRIEEEEIDIRNNEVRQIYDNVEQAQPQRIRNAYENDMQDVLQVIESLEINMRGIDTIISLLQRIKDKTNTHKNEHLEIIKLLNRGKIGTLEGLAREKVADPQLGLDLDVRTNNDVLTQSVLGQPYDELAAVRKGGKKKRKTRKSGRKAGYRKTRSSTFSAFKKGGAK